LTFTCKVKIRKEKRRRGKYARRPTSSTAENKRKTILTSRNVQKKKAGQRDVVNRSNVIDGRYSAEGQIHYPSHDAKNSLNLDNI